MLLERNVAFDVAGHAFFIEDGAEWDNTLRGNLGLMVRRLHVAAAFLVGFLGPPLSSNALRALQSGAPSGWPRTALCNCQQR